MFDQSPLRGSLISSVFILFFLILNLISSVFNLFEFYEALWISLVLAISWYCELRKRVMYETDFDVMNGLLES